VVYAGFSAGGLATLIAASTSNAKAWLALDAVDANFLAAPALDAIDAPLHAMVSEPSSCNTAFVLGASGAALHRPSWLAHGYSGTELARCRRDDL
jgi:hypothetical protein